MSVARDHADWLSLLEISGPFVSMPVLMRVFPQGLDPRDPEQARQLRLAYEEWLRNPTGPGKQRAWISHVLKQLLKFPADLITEGQSLPPGMSAAMPEYGETLRPDLALVGPKGTDVAGKPHLLVSVYPPDQLLDRPVTGKHWKATAATRMMELLHAADTPLGLVTNGEQWMLVFAPRGETTGFSSWYATLWIEEQVTLRAFHSLLSVNRFFGVAASDTLSALLTESAKDQQEVTNQLGDQVRDAVEVLIQAFDLLDHESGRALLKGVEEKTLYDAALTVMMRLVFLFSAEERDLLHLGRPIYDNNYAVSTLREQLQEVADRYGEEVLERRFDAWARLLSSFRAVHGGVQHQDLLMPAYGGSLFDPNRYAFLEGRAQETDWRVTNAEPLAIDNRVVLHLLKSLQMLQVKVPGGDPAEARRISFRALDIEQIGHIYEGLLDHNAFRARETVLGLVGTRKNSTPNITLGEIERLVEQSEDNLLEELKELTGRSIPALKRALTANAVEGNHKILVACGQDEKLAKRAMRFVGLLREDSFERPVVVLQGGIYVSEGTARSSTGTHYTPRSLTEPIVQHTIEPLVYRGPAEGLSKEKWELKAPHEILDLKVCDMTMGSGAFLVQVCRYLSERLVESWENLEKTHPGDLLITPEGLLSRGEPSERLIPKEANERLAIARRLIADRCLYGVDINQMAVEMAKLSIWLITVDRTRPFTFLDHALKCGDSLLGISGVKQLEKFSLDDDHEIQLIILSNYQELLRNAVAKRRTLEALPSNNAEQVASKQVLNFEAEELMSRLELACDLLIGAILKVVKGKEEELARARAHLNVTEYFEKPVGEFRNFVRGQIKDRYPFHWPLRFPEVFESGGFDAVIGNPPYLGGSRISGTLGDDYLSFLLRAFPDTSGNGDLASFFIRRAAQLLRNNGSLGLVTTNSISQGTTRENCLDYLTSHGHQIYRAWKTTTWPGGANVFVSILHIFKGCWFGEIILGDRQVTGISPYLDSSMSEFIPKRLSNAIGIVFRGSTISGEGFILTESEKKQLIEADPQSAEVIRPFLTGQDINQRPLQRSERFAIDFDGLPEEKATVYKACWERLYNTVRIQRQDNKIASREKFWWQYIGRQEGLYSAIAGFARVLGCGQVSKYWTVSWIEPGQVYADKVVVFALSSDAHFAVLNSCFHTEWAEKTSSRLKDDPNYNLAKTFETFPFPVENSSLNRIGNNFHIQRQQCMRSRPEGLTSIYNRFHDDSESAADISRLRALQKEMDQTVAAAYGWNDLDLKHDFYITAQGVRYTICEDARQAVLDHLLALNHQCYLEETSRGSLRSRTKNHVSKSHKNSGRFQDKSDQSALFIAEDIK
jgi:hypothetical protein